MADKYNYLVNSETIEVSEFSDIDMVGTITKGEDVLIIYPYSLDYLLWDSQCKATTMIEIIKLAQHIQWKWLAENDSNAITKGFRKLLRQAHWNLKYSLDPVDIMQYKADMESLQVYIDKHKEEIQEELHAIYKSYKEF